MANGNTQKTGSSPAKLSELFLGFFESEKAGGIVLVCCTLVSLVLANSAWSKSYLGIWHTDLGGHALEHWVNDALMAFFFLLVGLELKREIYVGELSNLKNAALPIFGALGGMLVPAGIFLALNLGRETQPGAGIPMATDIAFAVGILSLLGSRVPPALKIFLTALAVIDDLGAILVIAIFYTDSLSLLNLGLALGVFALLGGLNKLGVKNLFIYLAGGVAMWYFISLSGIHATITGVLLAFAIPFGNGDAKTPSYRLQSFLHKPVAFLVMPVFALANTGIVLEAGWYGHLAGWGSLGILLGLALGKPLGIWAFSYLSAVSGWTSLPEGLRWKQIAGVGCLGGIGFTMSIFITLLAFDDAALVTEAKIAILLGSTLSGLMGYLWLGRTLHKSV